MRVGPDQLALIDQELGLEAAAQAGLESRQRLLDRVGHLHRVGARLLDDLEDDRVAAVEPGDGAPLGDAVGDAGHFFQANLGTGLPGRDGKIAQLLDALELAQRSHRQLGGAEREVTGGQVQVLHPDALGDLVGAGADRLYLVEIQLDLDLAHVATGDPRFRDALDLLQARLHAVLDQLAQAL